MRAVLRSLTTDLDGDPEAFDGLPDRFGFFMQAEVGSEPGTGGDLFGFTVCSPEWLRRRCETDEFVSAKHHIVVRAEDYSNRALSAFLDRLFASVEGPDWESIASKLQSFGYWEFENYQPS
jgi:hypothetical protein